MFSLWKLVLVFDFVVCANGFLNFPVEQHKIRNQLSQVLDKDCSYCEKPLHFLSVNDLVFYYGDRENWWGDQGAHKTRHLYHQLLPTYHSYYIVDYNMETLAIKSYETRKAIKQYVRRRSYLHIRIFSIFIETMCNLWKYKRLRPIGATYEELWKKYEKKILETQPHLGTEELNHRVALTIIHKSCCTNKYIDFLFH